MLQEEYNSQNLYVYCWGFDVGFSPDCATSERLCTLQEDSSALLRPSVRQVCLAEQTIPQATHRNLQALPNKYRILESHLLERGGTIRYTPVIKRKSTLDRADNAFGRYIIVIAQGVALDSVDVMVKDLAVSQTDEYVDTKKNRCIWYV